MLVVAGVSMLATQPAERKCEIWSPRQGSTVETIAARRSCKYGDAERDGTPESDVACGFKAEVDDEGSTRTDWQGDAGWWKRQMKWMRRDNARSECAVA